MTRKAQSKKAAKTADALPEDWQYETASAEVEQIIAELEQDGLSLDDAFGAFETAVKRLQECDKFLSDRQAQAEILIETLSAQYGDKS